MATYEVFLANQAGLRQKILANYVSLDLALVVNGVSQLQMVLPGGTAHDIDDFDKNYRIEVYRDDLLQGGSPFFIKRKELSLDRQGQYLITLNASHANWLLDAREILAYAGSSQAKATAEAADDIARRLVRENLGASAAHANRDIAAPVDVVQVEADAAEAATITLSFARNRLLDTLIEIAEKARKADEYVFFGIEQNAKDQLEFRVRVGQWGRNRINEAIVSPEFGNLINARRVWDWSNEVTVAASLGQGQKDNRLVKTSTDITTADSYGWFERAYNDSGTDNATALQASADARLIEGRALESLNGSLQETSGFLYGTSWAWGDRIRAEFDGEQITTWINTVAIHLAEGRETIDCKLENVI